MILSFLRPQPKRTEAEYWRDRCIEAEHHNAGLYRMGLEAGVERAAQVADNYLVPHVAEQIRRLTPPKK